MSVLDVINKIGEQENSLTSREFVSPFFNSSTIVTTVEKIHYTFYFKGRRPPGWYRFRPIDTKRAKIVGEADYEEIQAYLKCLPTIRVVLVMKQNGIYTGYPFKNNKFGIDYKQTVPILLTDDFVMDFDVVIGRFDGANIWYDSPDPINDPSKAEYLRECINKLKDHKSVRFTGLTIEEKAAYFTRITLDKKLVQKNKKDIVKEEVEFAGGKFISLVERKDFTTVTFEVDGERYSPQVSNNKGHQVISAGVCLSGGDRNFDLTSLVTVLREGQERNLIHRW